MRDGWTALTRMLHGIAVLSLEPALPFGKSRLQIGHPLLGGAGALLGDRRPAGLGVRAQPLGLGAIEQAEQFDTGQHIL